MSASPTSIEDETSEMKPYQTMRGHTSVVCGVAHLPDGQRIITGSDDGTLRLWERESGAQIGNAWEDDEGNKKNLFMALSPNGKTVATSHKDGTVKLWDMEMKKVTAKWTGHTKEVKSVCWSRDGMRVVGGSEDGTAIVWDMENGETILGPIETGHWGVQAVTFLPDASNFATGGYLGIKIWNARTGELLSTLERDSSVWSLVWTSDQKKLLAGNDDGSITIFDTVTWQQIALLDQHHFGVSALSLFHNDRLLASGSFDKTARLWNLDTNLPVGPPLHHQCHVCDTAFSADGRFLATACHDHNTYVWDVHAILQEAGLEHLLSASNVTARKSILDSNATRHSKKLEEHLTVAPRGFFDFYTIHWSSISHCPFRSSSCYAPCRSSSNSLRCSSLYTCSPPSPRIIYVSRRTSTPWTHFLSLQPFSTQHFRCDMTSIHLTTPHALVNHTPMKSAADAGSRFTNFNWSRLSPDIKRKHKQRRPDRNPLKAVDVPLGEATYGDYVANREDVVRPYSLFCCLSWCQKRGEKQHSPRQQYDIELMYTEQEDATPNDPMSTTEVRPSSQQEEFELSGIASHRTPEAGPSRLPGNTER